MAIAHFCDRCGRSCWEISGVVSIASMAHSCNGLPVYKKVVKELCEECYTEVLDFINGDEEKDE